MGLRDNVYDVHLIRLIFVPDMTYNAFGGTLNLALSLYLIGKRVVDFLLVLIELFC